MSAANQSVQVSPSILIWARETIGLSQADVAKKINKEESLIQAWEQGEVYPTFSQLEKLAYQVYKRPLVVFFLTEPPKETAVKQDFRTLPETDLSALSSSLRLTIRRGKYNQTVLKEVYGSKNPASELIHKDLPMQLKLDVAKAADEVRKYLGMNDEMRKNFSNASDAFAYYRDSIQEKGVFVFQYPLKGARGFSLMDAEFPVIVINSSDAPTAKNFTLFHELCHILFNTGGLFRNFVTEELQMGVNRVEQFCNAFASEVLMPARKIQEWLQNGLNHINHIWQEEELRTLAASFNVSKEVVLRRLLDMRLADQKQYVRLTKRWNEQYRKLKEERKQRHGGPAYQTLVISHLGKKFVYGVLENYHAGRSDVLRAAEFLGVRVNQVAKIENKLY